MYETRGGLPPGRNALLFSTVITGSFIMPSHIDTAGHIQALPSHGPLVGGVKVYMVSFRCEADRNRRAVGPESNSLTTRPPRPPHQRGKYWIIPKIYVDRLHRSLIMLMGKSHA